jgi:plasmid stabilization system protein ParE
VAPRRIVESDRFRSDLKKIGVSDQVAQALHTLKDALASNPLMGREMGGTGGMRLARIHPFRELPINVHYYFYNGDAQIVTLAGAVRVKM